MNGDYVRLCHEDLTLRDYFAAKAMQAFCNRFGPDIETKNDWYMQVGAPHAYLVADAMLAARERKT